MVFHLILRRREGFTLHGDRDLPDYTNFPLKSTLCRKCLILNRCFQFKQDKLAAPRFEETASHVRQLQSFLVILIQP